MGINQQSMGELYSADFSASHMTLFPTLKEKWEHKKYEMTSNKQNKKQTKKKLCGP
jgi:hypothetical protein